MPKDPLAEALEVLAEAAPALASPQPESVSAPPTDMLDEVESLLKEPLLSPPTREGLLTEEGAGRFVHEHEDAAGHLAEQSVLGQEPTRRDLEGLGPPYDRLSKQERAQLADLSRTNIERWADEYQVGSGTAGEDALARQVLEHRKRRLPHPEPTELPVDPVRLSIENQVRRETKPPTVPRELAGTIAAPLAGLEWTKYDQEVRTETDRRYVHLAAAILGIGGDKADSRHWERIPPEVRERAEKELADVRSRGGRLPGRWEDVGRAWMRGIYGTQVATLGGFLMLHAGLQYLAAQSKAGRAVAAEGAKVGQELMQGAQDIIETRLRPSPEAAAPGTLRWWVAGGIEQTPNLLANIATGRFASGFMGASQALSFLAYAAPTFVQEAGATYPQAYAALRQRGFSEKQSIAWAAAEAIPVGLANAAIEVGPFAEFVLTRNPIARSRYFRAITKVTPSIITRTVEPAFAEATEEFFQEFNSSVAQALIRGDPNAMKGWTTRATQNATLALLPGGAMGLTTHLAWGGGVPVLEKDEFAQQLWDEVVKTQQEALREERAHAEGAGGEAEAGGGEGGLRPGPNEEVRVRDHEAPRVGPEHPEARPAEEAPTPTPEVVTPPAVSPPTAPEPRPPTEVPPAAPEQPAGPPEAPQPPIPQVPTPAPETPTEEVAAPPETAPAPPAQAPELPELAGREPTTEHERLASEVERRLEAGQSLDAKDFFALADQAYGKTRAEGGYGPSDAYDALETGINRFITNHPARFSPAVSLQDAVNTLGYLRNLMDRIPSQTNRSGEKDLMQQFSTPPPYAFAVNWLANIGPEDVVLEPSAGTGSLAVFAKDAGATVYANELSERRARLLSFLIPTESDAIFHEDAEQLYNILGGPQGRLAKQGRAQPTVVVMNPPFSRAGQRMGLKRMVGTDLRHVDAALKLLAPGGRLVAIVSAPLRADPTAERNSFAAWLARTSPDYNIRANILMPRPVYAKYGTSFPTRVLVVDKTGPTTHLVATAVDDLYQLMARLEGVRNDRIRGAYREGTAGEGRPATAPPLEAPASPEQTPAEPVLPPVAQPGEGPGERRPPVQPPGAGLGPGEPGAGRPLGQSPVGAPGVREPGGPPGPEHHPEVPVRGGRPEAPAPGGVQQPPGTTPGEEPGGRGGAAAGELPGQPGVGEPVLPAPDLGLIGQTEAGKDFLAALDDLADYVREQPAQPAEEETGEEVQAFVSPTADPRLQQLASKVAAQGAKAGIRDFADLVRTVAKKIGDGLTRTLGPALRQSWEELRSQPGFAHLSPSQDVEAILAGMAARVAPAPPTPQMPEGGPQPEQVLFESYRPSESVAAQAKLHPGALVESAAMASVPLPPLTYQHHLPKEVLEKGLVSAAQLESVVLAGQAHGEMLEPLPGEAEPVRRASAVGDGTGVGKGRINAAIILDNFMQGRKKAVWISQNKDLLKDARRDWAGIGQDPNLVFTDVASGARMRAARGVYFLSYDTLKAEPKEEKIAAGALSRIDQIVDWVGKDFDGVVVFDESHNMGNLIAVKGERVTKKPALKALAGARLQALLPKARVVFSSATFAIDVVNLAYAARRLQLFGPGTCFPTLQSFVAGITEGGVAAMEVVARDLKAAGRYTARSLSLNDGTEKGTVTYDRLVHPLTPEQKTVYNKLCEAWRVVLTNYREAFKATDAANNKKTVSETMSQVYGTQLRCFNQVLTSMAIPAAVQRIEQDLAAGNSVVLQLTNTHEADQKRELAKRDPDEPLEDFDITPREGLMNLVRGNFPTQMYEKTIDDKGNEQWVPVVDADGNPVLNPEAVAAKERLLDELGSISIPDSPLDMILIHFGWENVAEVTGRGERVSWITDEEGNRKRLVQRRTGRLSNKQEVAAFQGGKKHILIFSLAGATGASYHSDLDADNQEHRVHYVLQPGWRADWCMQGLGRTHRSNQASAPTDILLSTDIKAQARFTSTIARRLDKLGAVSRGQAKAVGAGTLFDRMDNLESNEAKDALYRLFLGMYEGSVGINIREFEDQTGLKLLTEQGNLRKDLPEMRQFLNRLLAMPIDSQNLVFAEFEKLYAARLAQAEAEGTLDQGLETYRADKVVKKEEQVVHSDPSGAKTNYVKLEVSRRNTPTPWSVVESADGFVRAVRSGKVYAKFTALAKTDARTGRQIPQVHLRDVTGQNHYMEEHRIWNSQYWQHLDKAEAQQAWEAALKTLPEFHTRTEHVITGALLPIWDRLKGRPRIFRITTDTGERLLGRIVPPAQIRSVLKALNAQVELPELTLKDAVPRLLAYDIQLKLANDWVIRPTYVQGELRIELVGPDFQYFSRLQEQGLFTERVQNRTRVFVPVGEKAPAVLREVLRDHPVSEVIYLKGGAEAQAPDDEGADDVELMAFQSPQARIPVAMDEPPGPRAEPVSAMDVLSRMADDFNVPIRSGWFRQRAEGIYKERPEVVRLKSQLFGDLAVASHEVAHHIAKETGILEGLPQFLQHELGSLDYDPVKKRPGEGFAEFLRTWLTTDEAASAAPAFSNYFEGYLQTYPELEVKLNGIRELASRWRDEGALGRVQAQVSQERRPGRPRTISRTQWYTQKLGDLVLRAYAAMKDDIQPIQNLDKFVKAQGLSIPEGGGAADRAYALSQTGPAHAEDALQHGIHTMGDKPRIIGPGLRDVFADIAPADYDDFVTYLYARHAVECHQKGVNPGISLPDASYVRDKLESPVFSRAAQTFTDMMNAAVDMLADVGVYTAREAELIKKRFLTYVPLLRVHPDQPKWLSRGRKLANLPDPIKRRFGSGLPVWDPVQASVYLITMYYTRAAQQVVTNQMVREAEKAEGAGHLIERVPPGARLTSFSLEEVTRQLEGQTGIDLAEALKEANLSGDEIQEVMEATLRVFRPQWFVMGNKHIVREVYEGRNRLYYVDKHLYDSVMALQHFANPWFMDLVFGKAARAVRLGATGLSTAFAARNPIRDYGTYFVNWKLKGAGDLVSPLGAALLYVASELNEMRGLAPVPCVRLWKMMGGPLATRTGTDRQSRAFIQKVIADSTARRALGIVMHPVEALREAFSVSEVGPRIAVFRSVLRDAGYSDARLEEMLNRGELPPMNVLVKAINEANDVTVNFKRMGWAGRYVNANVAFFNASLEGLDRSIRKLRDDPLDASMKLLSMAAMTAAYWWWKKDEDWYQEAEPWLKYGFWTASDSAGNPWVRIPRPFEYGWLTAGVEAVLNAAYEGDPEEVTRYFSEFLNQAAPPIMPSGIAPILENAANWDFFRRRAIVSPRLENLRPEDQYLPETTALARKVGQVLHVSPAKVEHLLEGYTGGLYGRSTRLIEDLAGGFKHATGADIPFVGGLLLRSEPSISVDQFYQQLTTATQDYNSAKRKGEATPEQARDYYRLNHVAELLRQVRNVYRGEQDWGRIREGQRYIDALARMALDKPDLLRYPNPLTDPNAPLELKEVAEKFLELQAYHLTEKKLESEAEQFLLWLFEDLGMAANEVDALARMGARRRGLKPNPDLTSAYQLRRRRLALRLRPQ